MPRIVADQILNHLRQAGVTPQLSIIYLLLRSRIFIFGGLVMNSTIPVDLLELKTRFETWRTNRKYMREPIPDELWNAAAELSRRHPPSLVGHVLKLDSSKLKKLRSNQNSPIPRSVESGKKGPVISIPEVGGLIPVGAVRLQRDQLSPGIPNC
jgi:hypothetical protein